MSEGGQSSELREQDKWLPIANVYRIMKNSLPKNAKVSKEAKECVQECVSEFVSFITSEASEKCAAEKRKTVNGEDILYAMALLGFENYAEVLKIYLTKYREYLAVEKAKRDREKNGSYDGEGDEDNDGDIYAAGSEIDLKTEQYTYPAFSDEHQDSSMYGEYTGEFSAVSGAQF